MDRISPGLIGILTDLHDRQEVALRNNRCQPMTLKEALRVIQARAFKTCPNLKELTELVEHAGEDELIITVLYFNGNDLNRLSLHESVVEAIDQIDAALFTGNPAQTFRDLNTLSHYVARWTRCLNETREAMHKELDERPRE